MPKKIRKPLPINQSCLYKINSRKRLAAILFTTEKKLLTVVNCDNRYETFNIQKKDGSERQISAPNIGLKVKQKKTC